MSVQCNHYVVLGVKRTWEQERSRLGLSDDFDDGVSNYYDKWTDSAFDPKKLGLVALVDGMNGKYIIVGQVLASTHNYEGFDRPTRCKATKAQRDSVRKELEKHFNMEDPKIGIWVVSHYR